MNSIQSRLSSNLSSELKEQLVTAEPGKPFYMLLLGVDRGEGREEMEDYGSDPSAYRTDTIILARIDPPSKKVTLISIHRDTAVMLDGKMQKINAAYSIGGEAYATQVVSEFAGVPISHYAEVDFYGLCDIVDQLGGIEVNVPVDVIDPEYTHANIKAGLQLLNGNQALQLCRARHAYDDYGDGDLFRAANQRMVISAILKKILKQDPVSMVSTINTLADSVNTDLEIGQIVDLANSFRGMNVETDIMTGMNPTNGELVDDVWWEISDNDAWQAMMQRVNAGLPPNDETYEDETAGIAGASLPTEEQIASLDTLPEPVYDGTVRVLNATDVEGIASNTAYALQDYGFYADADNTDYRYPTSCVVYDDTNCKAAAYGVYLALGGYDSGIGFARNDGSFSTMIEGYDVLVILGADRAQA